MPVPVHNGLRIPVKLPGSTTCRQWRNVNHVNHSAPPAELFGAPTKSKNFTVSKNKKRSLLFCWFFYRLVEPLICFWRPWVVIVHDYIPITISQFKYCSRYIEDLNYSLIIMSSCKYIIFSYYI